MAIRICDIECLPNYFLLLALDPATGVIFRWERLNEVELGVLSRETLVRMLHDNITVTFNGLGYDWPMLSGYLAGFTNSKLHTLSTFLIEGDALAPYRVEEQFAIAPLTRRHIDLMPVAPQVASLKVYGARLHTPTIQDFPIDPHADITVAQVDALYPYCRNDLYCTMDLYDALKPELRLRRKLSADFGTMLLSKSDAQIAERVIRTQLTNLGVDSTPNRIKKKEHYRYRVPAFLKFETEPMQDAFSRARNASYTLTKGGSVAVPPELRKVVKFNGMRYKMGLGGLHSQEKRRSLAVGYGEYLCDLDVTSYYPMLILTNNFFPAPIGESFIDVYRDLVTRRVTAKNAGDKSTADSLKIVINSTFGKMGNRHSALYDPQCLLQTTITGQLSMLMLIEMVEQRSECKVISANTDGITVHAPNKAQYKKLSSVADEWQERTALNLENTEYEAIYSQDVSNYLAIKSAGGTKGIGVFAQTSLKKNPVFPIVPHAVSEFLVNHIPIVDTIRQCTDILQFIALRKATGGAEHRGVGVGKTLRWYMSVNGEPIYTLKAHSMVANSAKAELINRLPLALPNDIDYEEYIKRADLLLEGVGALDYVVHTN